MKKKTLLTLLAIVIVSILSISAFAAYALSQSEIDALIEAEVIKRVDEQFENIAESVNNSSEGAGYTADYTDKKLTFTVTADNAEDLIDIITVDKIYDVVTATLPIVFVSDEVYIDGIELYDGTVNWNGVKKFAYNNMMGLEDFSKLESKTLFEATMTLKVYGVSIDVPVSLVLDITDKQFTELKQLAYKASTLVEIYRDNDVYYVRVDARKVYHKLLEEVLLEEGYTVKEVRDRLNRLTLRDAFDKVDSLELTGRFERFDEEYKQLVKLVEKVIKKVDGTKYATYLDTPVGILDRDNDGVYGDARTVTIPVESIINKLEAYAVKYIPEYDGTYDISAMVGIKSVTISYDVEIAVHYSYTATFLGEDGTLLYQTTILEGEVPEYVGATPEKDADEEYIYTFAGWFDGTTLYEVLPELLADTTYTAQFTSEPNVCKHPNATFVEGFPADCVNPGMTDGTICPDCGEIIDGCEEILPTGIHFDEDGEWDHDDTTHFYICFTCGDMFEIGNHDGDATCVSKAVCTVCGIAHGDVDGTVHNNTVLRDVVEVECTVDGHTGNKYCEDCGVMVEEGTVITAPGHNYGEWETVTEPSTTAPGLKKQTCGNCGDVVEETIPQLPDEPATGDNTIVVTVIAMISLAGMALVVMGKKKFAKN